MVLQVDLGKLNTVTAVATQGRYRGKALVRSYQMAFSRQEGEWFYYKEHGEVKVSSFSALNCKAISTIIRLEISSELSTIRNDSRYTRGISLHIIISVEILI